MTDDDDRAARAARRRAERIADGLDPRPSRGLIERAAAMLLSVGRLNAEAARREEQRAAENAESSTPIEPSDEPTRGASGA